MNSSGPAVRFIRSPLWAAKSAPDGYTIPDLISNRVSVMINPMLALINYVKAGSCVRLR